MGSGASKLETMESAHEDSVMALKDNEVVVKILAEKHGVKCPELPGDILLSGEMDQDVVKSLAQVCKGWLYVNPRDDPKFYGDTIQSEGCQLEVVPFSPKTADKETIEKLHQALDMLPRPAMIQCTSANRAALTMFLWMAKHIGYSGPSADLLVEDMKLDNFRPELRQWMVRFLPDATDAEVARQLSVRFEGVRQLFEKESSTLTYLVSCPESKEAALIDPVLETMDRDLKIVKDLGLQLKYVLNTHCHADHVTSGGAIRKEIPEVKTIISEASGAKADQHVRDGDKVSIGKLTLEVRATPGHTDGCVTYVLRTPSVGYCFTGDTLLVRGCGRTDFQQGSNQGLYESVHKQIFSLPGDFIVCPGHDYKGRSVSLVAEERLYNPRLTKSLEGFTEIMNNLGLAHPKKMDVAVPANMVCGLQDMDPTPAPSA